jgi:hypothetical protein
MTVHCNRGSFAINWHFNLVSLRKKGVESEDKLSVSLKER